MKSQKGIRIALIGTDSFRGKEIKNVLEHKKFPLKKIEFFDPEVREEYSKLTEFRGTPRVVLPLDAEAVSNSDLVFLASDEKTNREYGNLAASGNYLAIDLNETFNANKKIPIVVAGVNHLTVLDKKPPLIANPHPVTIILVHFLHVILKKFHPLKIAAFVLQPVSAFYESGIEELASQSIAVLSSASISPKTFKAQVAFNLLSDTGPIDKNGFSLTEKQTLEEIKRVLGIRDLPLSLAIIQVPVFHTYSIMIHLELEEQIGMSSISDLFKKSEFFEVSSPKISPSISSIQVAGKDKIYIGQIKKDVAFPNRYWIWTVADNLTRGSALNAYEIMESGL